MSEYQCQDCHEVKPVEILDCVACTMPVVKNMDQFQMKIEEESEKPCQCTLEHPCCQVKPDSRHRFMRPQIPYILTGMAEIKPKCCKKRPERRMPNTIEITKCLGNKRHPCDPVTDCNPCEDEGGECKPSICLEKLKNPAMPGEATFCKPGGFIKISPCDPRVSEPRHPCDPPLCIPGYRKRVKCPPVALCYHRIKNPLPKPNIKCPENKTGEAHLPKQELCVIPGSPEYKAMKKHCAPKREQWEICEMVKKYWAPVPKDT